ncbi:MAG TPA: hypothetical protein VFU59_00720 [Candidatus Eisenbacteria bacterium]|nr:hypothetical protein [Candidatus Eisenbacteria bacterium]
MSAPACAPVGASSPPRGSLAGETTVPLTTIEFAGHRYVADAELDAGGRARLMIHGNASMFLMLTHEIGERVNGGPVPKQADYGYSAKGKGSVRVGGLRLAGRSIADIPEVPVFDYVAEGASPAQGMLGVPFLARERAAVDFARDVMILGVRTGARPDRGLLDRGYRSVAMIPDATGKLFVEAYFPSLGRTIPLTPSTVSSALTLHRPPFVGRLPMLRDTTDTDHSPSRTHPALYRSERVAFSIGGAAFESPASLEDFAEYANRPETDLESLGYLGYDWMKAHAAVIDYANRVLYFRP